ncbi:tryptophan RNA-binding attenuator protein [Thermodesulfobium narugense DSM 14796]|uniref:Transcription attenuation protein MtrB n=2 Tax=Thermodesulfobium narugense TaxID=184064 RepID=M1E5A9_9BACT|nr:trp RNA-binding attenuation protein MtrB [Thermodesulfobium narugense]AEE14957.1 tryptophan RNA-binding attenuator protein [Thermodesulfobium narugense DSM 14796]
MDKSDNNNMEEKVENFMLPLDTKPISTLADYVVIKALADGVMISGMTRGKETKFHHSERIDAGEVVIAQFTDNTSAMKVRGKAKILTKYGIVYSGMPEKE